MKKVYIVTHGKAVKDKPDPQLTIEGKKQMKKLKEFLANEKFDYIVSGVGKRHRQAFEIILGKKRKPNLYSEFIGVPESISVDLKTMIFPDGKKMSIEEYVKTRYQKLSKGILALLKRIFEKKGENALIIGGRIVPLATGIEIKNVESGVLYIFNEKRKLIKTIKC